MIPIVVITVSNLTVVRSEGLLGIYSGLKHYLLGTVVSQGVYYYFYQKQKKSKRSSIAYSQYNNSLISIKHLKMKKQRSSRFLLSEPLLNLGQLFVLLLVVKSRLQAKQQIVEMSHYDIQTVLFMVKEELVKVFAVLANKSMVKSIAVDIKRPWLNTDTKTYPTN
ncbi:hypothetical protein T459_09250 [Capsicum annuum]|uniref:Peroxisomal nicotinamide adenine dinucleotide carrier-like n=1 Tax=Capsicum annuum TaxID=4072 RepID=A0A2G2ZYU8_CAPAN|nr:hypothetical protein T459_09250 [Capsicum annuum]